MVVAAAVTGLVAVTLAGVLLRRRGPVTPAAPAAVTPDAGSVSLDEREPNDRPDQAQPLPASSVDVKGSLGAGDRDFFRVEARAPGGNLLQAHVEGLEGARIEVRNEGGAVLATATAPSRIAALGLVAGTYFVAVDGSKTGAYRLLAEVSPWTKGLEWEPNDDPDHAQDMAKLELPEEPPGDAGAADTPVARHVVSGWWESPSDVDCFTLPLEVPRGGAVLRIELRPPPGVTSELRVLDHGNPRLRQPSRQLAMAKGEGPGKTVVVPALGARSWEASYVVCVRAAGGSNVAQRYRLDVSTFTPAGRFEFEPNDVAADATPLETNQAVAGYLPLGDVDWYRAPPGLSGSIEATLTLPAGMEAELTLLDAAAHEGATARGVSAKPTVLSFAGAALVRVRVLAGGSDSARYHLTVGARRPPAK